MRRRERVGQNIMLIRGIDARWGVLRPSEADEQRKPLIKYKEWIAIEGK